MPLFRDHPVRSVFAVTIALSVAHFATKVMSSLHAFHLTQTSVAILAIASFIFMITMHHRREGQLMTQTQEEMALIGGFALFCFAVLVAWRVMRHDGSGAGETSLARASGSSIAGSQRNSGYDVGLPYGCSRDDSYCIVEEYYF